MDTNELCELACLLRLQPLVGLRDQARIPKRSGLYAAWRKDDWQCFYVGAAASLRQRIVEEHYQGLREADLLSLSVYDIHIHPLRVAEEARGIRRNSRGLNKMTRDWVRENVRFQFVELPKGELAEAEEFFRLHWQPTLNARRL